MIRVGMSGFSYPDWIGDFYPAGTKRGDMLRAYAERLDTVEINMTFRRMPSTSVIDGWRSKVPEGFRFSLKAPQRITHFRKLVDVGEDVAAFLERVQGLGDGLGPLLFQIPPSMAFDAGVLDGFGAGLPPGGTYAFEPRHASFAGDEADDVLRRHGLARCLNDELFDASGYVVTGPVAYFRMRGTYDDATLATRAELFRRLSDGGVDVYCYFKHEDDPESTWPALRMRDLIT